MLMIKICMFIYLIFVDYKFYTRSLFKYQLMEVLFYNINLFLKKIYVKLCYI